MTTPIWLTNRLQNAINIEYRFASPITLLYISHRDMEAIDGVVMPRQKSLKVIFSILIEQVAIHLSNISGLRIAFMPSTEK